MEIRELEVQERLRTGKGVARKLRAQGKIPAVCYRKGRDPVSISLDQKELTRLLHTTAGQNVLIQLLIQGTEPKKRTVILKEIQRHPLSGIFHVDFMEVLLDEAITVEVPLRLVGEPVEALRQGGLVQQLRMSLEVECLPTRIPDQFTIDISSLKMGGSVHVEEIQVEKDVRILTDPKEPIVILSAPEVEKVEEVEAEAEAGEEAEEATETGAGTREKGS